MQEFLDLTLQFISPVPILIWVCALVLLVAVLINLRSQRQVRNLKKELLQTRSDIRALTTSSLGVGGRLKKLEQHQRQLAVKQDEFEHEHVEQAGQPYEHAIHLARQGADVNEIVDMCGVSRNEAELIQMMHRFEKAS